MAGIAGGALAAAVTRAGGLGFIGGGYGDGSWIEEQLDIATDAEVGVGLITWALRDRPGLVERLIRRGVRRVWLSFGDPAPHIPVLHEAGAVALCQVQTVAEARRAASIGSGPWPWMPLGSSTASDEALDSDAAKDRLVAGTATRRTNVFDLVRGPGVARRLHGTGHHQLVHHPLARPRGRAARRARHGAPSLSAGGRSDDTDVRVVWAGTGVSRIHGLLPAGDIVRAISP